METRRKEVGRQIKIARRRAGFSSQGALATAIGKHETSVANAERGSDRVGEAVYNAIEDQLGWPADGIAAYVAGAGPEPWRASAAPSSPAAATEPEDDWTPEEIERVRGMSADQIVAEARMIGKFSEEGEVAQLRYLRKAADIKLQKPVTPPS